MDATTRINSLFKNTSKEGLADELGSTRQRKNNLLKAFDIIFDRGAKAFESTKNARGNPFSWGISRVHSVLAGGKARNIDKDVVRRFNLPLLRKKL